MSNLLAQLELTVEEEEQIELELEEGGSVGGVKDYNDLINKPTLNGEVIQGDMSEQDPTVPQWAKEPNKPTYTPKEIGAVNGNDAITLQEINDMFKQVFGE